MSADGHGPVRSERAGVTIEIDRELCFGFGDCVDSAPDVFELDAENKSIVVGPEAIDRDDLLDAARDCPVDAILVVDPETGQQLHPLTGAAVGVDPGALVLVGGAAVLYEMALARLRARGRRVSGWQRAAWYGGLALVGIGLIGPVDAYAERALSAHMAQHLLIADLAAPLLLAGLRTPVLQFLVPAPALRRLARLRRVRHALSVLRRPLVAIPVYALVLYGWHLGFMFEAAMQSSVVHALQHQSFLAASLLVWWAPLEPTRRRVPGELWKAGHVLGARLVGMFLGMGFIAMRIPVYVEAYGPGARPFGLTPVADQQVAGGLMLGVDLLIMLAGFAFFFWRAAQDHDRPEALAPGEHLR